MTTKLYNLRANRKRSLKKKELSLSLRIQKLKDNERKLEIAVIKRDSKKENLVRTALSLYQALLEDGIKAEEFLNHRGDFKNALISEGYEENISSILTCYVANLFINKHGNRYQLTTPI